MHVYECVGYSEFILCSATYIMPKSIWRPRKTGVARTGTKLGLFSKAQLSA